MRSAALVAAQQEALDALRASLTTHVQLRRTGGKALRGSDGNHGQAPRTGAAR